MSVDYGFYLTGWRAWTVLGGALHGVGIGSGEPWPPGLRAEAVCTPQMYDGPRPPHPCPHCGLETHEPPVKTCHCGFWAFKTRESLEQRLTVGLDRVVGRVALWGRVMEHELGWRAQWAYPLELWAGDEHRELLQVYRVPVGRGEEGPQLLPSAVSLWPSILPSWQTITMPSNTIYYLSPNSFKITGLDP